MLVDDEKIKFIQGIIDIYGKYSADELEDLTHAKSPWCVARMEYQKKGTRNTIISDATIKSYYSRQEQIRNRIINFICV